jgi:SP family sugar:H+ symporter-like MFS transporter
LLNWAIAYATPYMVDEKGANLQSKVFFVWGTFCFICIAFVWFMIYETKGLTLEQVDELYGTVKQAWKSSGFEPQVSYNDLDPKTQRGMSLTDIGAQQTSKRQVQHEEMMPAEKA